MAEQIDLRGQPNAVNVLHETRKFFEDAQKPARLQVELDPGEQTVDGFIELGWDHAQLQRSLHLDFQHEISGWDRDKLEAEAAEHVATLNESRAQQGSQPLDVRSMDSGILSRVIEPQWLNLAQLKDYDALTQTYPEHMKANLDELREVDAKLRLLSKDDKLRASAQEYSQTQTEAIKAATAWIRADAKIDECAKKISELYQAAASSGRPLTKADTKHIARLEARQADLQEHKGSEINSPDMIAPTVKQIERLERRKRRREFEAGIVVTESMKQLIAEVLPSLARGNPARFVGETGGAKTALAKFLATVYMGKEPEMISGYSDVNGYQLMGKTGLGRSQSESSQETIRRIVQEEGLEWEQLDPKDRIALRLEGVKIDTASGATISDFIAGPVVRAMEAGVPLILDEINAMPAEFMKRINDITQLRPGKTMTVQEDSGRQVTVRPGFCIVATMNEKSKRYKGVDDLSTEIENRFAATTHRLRYPDYDTANGQIPKENLMIAVAALTDEIGELAVNLPEGQLINLVKAAHISQKLFSGSYTEDEARPYVSTSQLVDGIGLEATVLAPRTMVAILEEVRASYGSISLPTILHRWLDGIKNKSDRAVIGKILDQNHLANDKS